MLRYVSGDAEGIQRHRLHLMKGQPGGTIPSPKGIESV
jgi:hypothetical protein